MSMRSDEDEQLYREALIKHQSASLRFFLHRFRLFGFGLLAASAAVLLLVEGMPLHALAQTAVGPVALVVWLGFLVMTSIYGFMALGKWLLMKQK